MRLPKDPCRTLGGRRINRKDRRPTGWAGQINPKVTKKRRKPNTSSYRRDTLNKIRKECKANKRTIRSEILKEICGDAVRNLK
jgi:hypothetical protein